METVDPVVRGRTGKKAAKGRTQVQGWPSSRRETAIIRITRSNLGELTRV